MEGLIPFIYRAIVQYRNNGHQHLQLQGSTTSWLTDSPSSSSTSYYIRLPSGDSGRFQPPDFKLFGSDSNQYYPSAPTPPFSAQFTAGAQSPSPASRRRGPLAGGGQTAMML